VTGPRQITLARLGELGITPDTRLGQHFLVDDNLVRVALRLADLVPGDVVLEIGPGLGVMTAALADCCRHVHAVEIDRRLEPALEATLAGRDNVTVHFTDAMTLDPASLDPAPTAFVSNLPYHVATALVAESLGGLPLVTRWAVMVQREAGDRFFAAPSTPAYGGVSVLVQLACTRTGAHRVSRAVFAPPPNVDSMLLGFRRSDGWAAIAPRWASVVQVVHAAFGHRRKTLVNALVLSGVADRVAAEEAIVGLGLDLRTRAEALPPPTFVALEAALRPSR
jgi:16S rRNA (adenine1518-N6/adenine1519-N6)-dimethyltransferase